MLNCTFYELQRTKIVQIKLCLVKQVILLLHGNFTCVVLKGYTFGDLFCKIIISVLLQKHLFRSWICFRKTLFLLYKTQNELVGVFMETYFTLGYLNANFFSQPNKIEFFSPNIITLTH